jgi:AraC-like DNA-binding protein
MALRAPGQADWSCSRLVHRNPSHPWTVESLANEVAMSRSAFAARFTSLVGEPAMHYVARWRMNVALTWLKEDDVPRGSGWPSWLRVGGCVQAHIQARYRILTGRCSTDDGRRFLALELMTGETLANRLAKGRSGGARRCRSPRQIEAPSSQQRRTVSAWASLSARLGPMRRPSLHTANGECPCSVRHAPSHIMI